MRQARLDYGELKSAERTVNGFLRAPCHATRAGILLYRNPDGSVRRELRPPEEVFAPESLATLASVPVTDEHPQDLINPKNASVYSRGVTGETIERDGDLVKCYLTVFDEGLITTLENRLKGEVSCGYTCDVEEIPGTYNGEPYDSVQKNIRYNHLAVVSKGRAGPEVRVRIDGADCVLQETTTEGQIPMAKIKLDNVEYEVTESVALAMTQKMRKDETDLAALQAQLTSIQAELDKMKGAYTAKEAENDSLKKELDEKPKDEDRKMDAAEIHSLVQARLDLIRKAESHLPKTVKLDTMSDRDIKIEVIKKMIPDFKADTANDNFIEGLFMGVVNSNTRTDSLARSITDARSTPSLSAAEARKRAMEVDRNAWKRA